MKCKLVLTAILFALCLSVFGGNGVVLDNGRVVESHEAPGQDQPYPFEFEEALPKAPAGYKPFFIEHYGRHGSRFAYDNIYYDTFKKALDQAERKAVLTDFGKKLKADYDSHYPLYHLRMGDLTLSGMRQQERLGIEMVGNYPSIFRRPGASVSAVSSDSRRAIMSMSGFCLGLAKAAPSLDIREDQGNCHLDATMPRSRRNPFFRDIPSPKFPFAETEEEFCIRKTGCFPDVLSRLFTDPDVALEGIGSVKFLKKLYVLVSGMNSLDEADRTDFSGVFTEDEYARLWEVDDYQRYHEYYSYIKKIVPVMRSLVDDADAAIADGRRGASLRFGHDHVIMPLLVLLRLNGYSRQPQSPDEVSAIFANIDCPMAGNIQLVLYGNRRGGDVLVNIRLNGRNASVDGLAEAAPGFYRWEEYKSLITEQHK